MENEFTWKKKVQTFKSGTDKTVGILLPVLKEIWLGCQGMTLFIVQWQPPLSTQLGAEHSIIGETWFWSRGNIDADPILKIQYLLATVISGLHIYEYMTGPSLTILSCPALPCKLSPTPFHLRSTFNILVNSDIWVLKWCISLVKQLE